MEGIEVGTITINRKVRVTDPCYNIYVWCATEVEVLPGDYKVTMGMSENRIAWLQMQHVGSEVVGSWEEDPADIGVDSGQAGFFDLQYYLDHQGNYDWYERVCNASYRKVPNPKYLSREEYIKQQLGVCYLPLEAFKTKEDLASPAWQARMDAEMWYSDSIHFYKEIGEFSAGILDGKGVNASSGYGDGSYTLYTGKDKDGNVVLLHLVFISEDEDEEQEDE